MVWTQTSYYKYVKYDLASVVLHGIVVDSDWCFDNLYGSHLDEKFWRWLEVMDSLFQAFRK